MNPPTPETDAAKWTAARYATNDYVQVVDASVSAKLEQERDEARAELQTQLNNIKQYDYHYVLHVAERDQLRKVVDKLAEHVEGTVEIQCGYNSLPHVIAAKKGNEV